MQSLGRVPQTCLVMPGHALSLHNFIPLLHHNDVLMNADIIITVCIYVQIHFYKNWASTLTLQGQLKNKITSHLVISLPGDHHGDRTLQLVILYQTLCIIKNFRMPHRGYVAPVSTLLCIDIVEVTPTIDPTTPPPYTTHEHWGEPYSWKTHV